MSSACCVFDLTLSKEKCEFNTIKKFFNEVAKKWCFQEETGSETGYVHYQCRISLKLKVRLSVFVQKVKDTFGYANVHPKGISVTSEANKTNLFYVLKEDTRTDGPWRDDDEVLYIPRQIREIKELYPWQKTIIDDLPVWNTRTINVIIDKTGNNGKSTLSSWVRCYRLGRILPALNDAKDLMRATYDMPTSKAYLIDLPRALNKGKMDEMYSAIEQIKSGYCYDDRYNFREKIFDCPNIWIFTNTEPDRNLISWDRWKLWEIKLKCLVPYIPEENGETPEDF